MHFLTGKSKQKAVLDYVCDLLESDRKFICFAHHQTMLDALSLLAESKKTRYIRIDGGTSSGARHALCEQVTKT